MGRKGWFSLILAAIAIWLLAGRRRAGDVASALSRRVGGASAPVGAADAESGSAAIAAVVTRVSPAAVPPAVPSVSDQAPLAPSIDEDELVASFPGAERFEEPTAVDASDSAAGPSVSAGAIGARVDADSGDDVVPRSREAATGAPDGTMIFTPDASLNLVDDIEFTFVSAKNRGALEGSSAAVTQAGDAGQDAGRGEGADLPTDAVDSTPPATAAAVGDADLAAFTAEGAVEAGPGWVRGDGSRDCPDDHPIKGNANSHIYHLPGQPSYAATMPELCFATEDAAAAEGYRPTRRSQGAN